MELPRLAASVFGGLDSTDDLSLLFCSIYLLVGVPLYASVIARVSLLVADGIAIWRLQVGVQVFVRAKGVLPQKEMGLVHTTTSSVRVLSCFSDICFGIKHQSSRGWNIPKNFQVTCNLCLLNR